jgi:hypothetical protein
MQAVPLFIDMHGDCMLKTIRATVEDPGPRFFSAAKIYLRQYACYLG